jgi:hypothetical protein
LEWYSVDKVRGEGEGGGGRGDWGWKGAWVKFSGSKSDWEEGENNNYIDIMVFFLLGERWG